MACSRAPWRARPALLVALLAALLAVAAAARPQQQQDEGPSLGRSLQQDGVVTDAGATLAPVPASPAAGELCGTGSGNPGRCNMHAAQLSQEGGAEHDTASCACSLGAQHAKRAGRPLRTPCLLLSVASLPSQAQLMPRRLGLGSLPTAR